MRLLGLWIRDHYTGAIGDFLEFPRNRKTLTSFFEEFKDIETIPNHNIIYITRLITEFVLCWERDLQCK